MNHNDYFNYFQFEDNDFLYSAVKCALANKNSDVIKNWCHSEAVTNLLVEVAQDLVSKEHTKEFARNSELISMAFTVSKNKGNTFLLLN